MVLLLNQCLLAWHSLLSCETLLFLVPVGGELSELLKLAFVLLQNAGPRRSLYLLDALACAISLVSVAFQNVCL